MRVALHTLGCRTNQAELAGFRQALAAAGDDVSFVSWDEQADVYLLHSCTVTARADRQCRQKVRQAHRTAPEARIVISGCYAQRDASTLAALPGVQAVIGCSARASVPSVVLRGTAAEEVGQPIAPIDQPQPAPDPRRTRATLKIQEGCDHRCTYCVVPTVRGPSRSLPTHAVRAGALTLVQAGHPEIVLAGTHVGRWGRDLSKRSSLAELLEVLPDAAEPARIRLSSLDPREVTTALLQRIADDPRICRHLHLSMQHTDASILAAMGRPSAPRDVVREAATRVPGLCIGADVIAGFPGEDIETFERMRDELASMPLAYLHVFGYSARPGTNAEGMDGRVERRQLSERVASLRELSEEVLRPAFLRGRMGRDLDVVFERVSEGRLRGVSSEFASVVIEGDERLLGRRIGVRARHVEGSAVIGVLL